MQSNEELPPDLFHVRVLRYCCRAIRFQDVAIRHARQDNCERYFRFHRYLSGTKVRDGRLGTASRSRNIAYSSLAQRRFTSCEPQSSPVRKKRRSAHAVSTRTKRMLPSIPR